jgi:hypothetical protein
MLMFLMIGITELSVTILNNFDSMTRMPVIIFQRVRFHYHAGTKVSDECFKTISAVLVPSISKKVYKAIPKAQKAL